MHARFDNWSKLMLEVVRFPEKSKTDLTVNAQKKNRRRLTMLATLVAITVLGDVVGLVIHYALTWTHALTPLQTMAPLSGHR